MGESTDAFRAVLIRALDWEEAHATFDKAVDGIPLPARGARAAGFEHSPWQLLEHIRLAQEDLLHFCQKPNYVHTMKWPDDYWPANPAPPNEQVWADSVAAYGRDREAFRRLTREVKDLTVPVPTGNETQTYLRTILLAIDHAAYHVGQLVAVRRALGVWG